MCFWRNTSHERERLSAKINLLLSPKNNAGYAKNPSQHPEFKNERVRVPPPDLQQLPTSKNISKSPYHWYIYGLANVDMFLCWTPCKQTTDKETVI